MLVLTGPLFDGRVLRGPSTIRIERGVVEAVEEGLHPLPGEEVVDLRQRFVLPAFVNAHTHLAMTLLRGYAPDLPVQRWLDEAILPAEDQLTAEDVYWGALAGLAESIRSGVGTVADMYMHMDAVAEAVLVSGARAVLARGLVAAGEPFQVRLAEATALYDRWHGREGRLRVWFGPHAPYSCPPASLTAAVDAARARGVGIHIHLAETRKEVADLAGQGFTPLALLVAVGAADVPVLAAHMVHPTDEDFRLLPRLDVAIVTCPVSNLALGSGLPPVGTYLEAGIPLALGTDGAAPVGSLDFFLHLRVLRWLEKGRTEDPTRLPAPDALRLATAGGGAALRWSGLGTLAPGAPADLQALDLSALTARPVHDPVAAAVATADRHMVRDLFVAGRPLLREGELLTLDERDIARHVDASAARLSR